ncbi:MAG: HD domain-containing protein, partial [bacterium]|nr:HD domain-containing protein [bacterium]
AIESVRKLAAGEIEADDFCQSSPRPIEGMWVEIKNIIGSVKNEHLWAMLDRIFLLGQETSAKFKQAPAGKEVHHAFVGGLLLHTLEVVAYAEKMVELQGDQLDRDLLIAGCLLHDLGKIEEYEPRVPSFEFTDKGKLLGHLVIGAEIVGRAIDTLAGFPPLLRQELQHMILSHHGMKEWGSPEEPKTANAMALHLADLTSGRLSQIEKIINEMKPLEERWSSWDKRLGRSIFIGYNGGGDNIEA